MKKWILKMIICHLAVALFYLGLTDYEFVQDKYPHPIGIGIKQWLLMFSHLLITWFIGLVIRHYSRDRALATSKIRIQLFIIITIIILYAILSPFIWHWLWSFRSEVIQ
jgi:uncharacterized membrane protein AbrB (regulator of aidB expression)